MLNIFYLRVYKIFNNRCRIEFRSLNEKIIRYTTRTAYIFKYRNTGRTQTAVVEQKYRLEKTIEDNVRGVLSVFFFFLSIATPYQRNDRDGPSAALRTTSRNDVKRPAAALSFDVQSNADITSHTRTHTHARPHAQTRNWLLTTSLHTCAQPSFCRARFRPSYDSVRRRRPPSFPSRRRLVAVTIAPFTSSVRVHRRRRSSVDPPTSVSVRRLAKGRSSRACCYVVRQLRRRWPVQRRSGPGPDVRRRPEVHQPVVHRRRSLRDGRVSIFRSCPPGFRASAGPVGRARSFFERPSHGAVTRTAYAGRVAEVN